MASRNEVAEKLKKLTWNDLMKSDWLESVKQVAASADDQVELILSAIKAGQEFFDNANTVEQWVQNLIRQDFGNNVNITVFGSASTKLALKCSDVDIFIQFDKQDFDRKTRLNEIKNTIIKNADFKQVEAIYCSCPIVQFKSLGLSFDISFTKAMGVFNSILVNKFVSYENRLKNLIIILKFWMKKCVEKTYDSNRLRSSVLSFLAIFYLQQRHGVLPICDSMNSNGKKVEGWVVDTLDNLKGVDASFLKDVSIIHLLKGFFDYYSNFDFATQVICPFIGKSLPKSQISNPDLLPSAFSLYREIFKKDPSNKFQVDALSLQDPFVHVRNMADGSNAKSVDNFKKACKIASEIFDDNNYQNASYNRKLFYELFTSKLY